MQPSDNRMHNSIVLELEEVKHPRLTWFGLWCSDKKRYGAMFTEAGTSGKTVEQPIIDIISQPVAIHPDNTFQEDMMDVDDTTIALAQIMTSFVTPEMNSGDAPMIVDSENSRYCEMFPHDPTPMLVCSARIDGSQIQDCSFTYRSFLTPEERQLCQDYEYLPGVWPRCIPRKPEHDEMTLRFIFETNGIPWDTSPARREYAIPYLLRTHQIAKTLLMVIVGALTTPPTFPIFDYSQFASPNACRVEQMVEQTPAQRFVGPIRCAKPSSRPKPSKDAARKVCIVSKGTLLIEKTAFSTRALFTVNMRYQPNDDAEDGEDDEENMPPGGDVKTLKMGIDTGSGLTWVTENGFQQLNEQMPSLSDSDTEERYKVERWSRAQLRKLDPGKLGISWTKQHGQTVMKGEVVAASALQRYADGSVLYAVPMSSSVGYITLGTSLKEMNASICVMRAANKLLMEDAFEMDGILGLAPFTDGCEEDIGRPHDAYRPLLTQLVHNNYINTFELHWWQTPVIGGPRLILGKLPTFYAETVTETSDWMQVVRLKNDPTADRLPKWALLLTRIEILHPDGTTTQFKVPVTQQPIVFDTGSYNTFLSDGIMSQLVEPLGLIPDKGTKKPSADSKGVLVCDSSEELDLQRSQTTITFYFTGGGAKATEFPYTTNGATVADCREGLIDTEDKTHHPGSLLQRREELDASLKHNIWGVNGFKGLLASFRSGSWATDIPTMRLGQVRNMDPNELSSGITVVTS